MLAPYDAEVDAHSLVPAPHVARPLRLLPFRGLTLDPSRIGAPGAVRGFTRPYRHVAERLERWERRGHVQHDAEPAVYLHEYAVGDLAVRALVGALDISRLATDRDEVAVFPHEGIHPRQVDQLATRMREMQINPAPILLVHQGPERVRALLDEVQEGPPVREFVDRGGQRHRVWAVRDPGQLATVDTALAHQQVLIADGHHRYAAYLQLQRTHPSPAGRAGLAMLVDQQDTPLRLGPVHRVLARTSLADVADAARHTGAAFQEASREEALAALTPDTLAVTDGRAWSTVRLEVPADRLVVEVLHERLVPALRAVPGRVGYHHTVEDALDAVGRRRGTAVLMPAPGFAEVLAACSADRLLPEKATSFQPKPNVGVLIRSLRDG